VSRREDNEHTHHAAWMIVIILIAIGAMVFGAMLISPH
jgi:hypothetical protein